MILKIFPTKPYLLTPIHTSGYHRLVRELRWNFRKELERIPEIPAPDNSKSGIATSGV
jgi:hypothetical protein